MKILYIGQVVPEKKIKSCTGYTASGDIFQKNVLYSLASGDNMEIHVVSTYPNAAYPNDKVYIRGAEDVLENGMIAHNVSHINIPIIKQISQMKRLIKKGKELGKKTKFDLILCYNMYPQFGGAALALSRKLKCPLVAILADFPIKDNIKRNFLKNTLLDVLNYKTWKNISKVKYGVILNKNAKKYLNPACKTIIIPGGVQKENSMPGERTSNIKNVVYAGALTEYSGVKNLIHAFELLDIPDVKLEIYGDGELREGIVDIVKKHQNIQYRGKKTLDEMRLIMRNAWVLVNPRRVDDPISSVTFPSKIFEYIMTGRPVLTTEFEGMPEEIKNITFSCGDGSPERIALSLENLYNYDEETLKRFSKVAYDYVNNEMNWDSYKEKMVCFFEDQVIMECNK